LWDLSETSRREQEAGDPRIGNIIGGGNVVSLPRGIGGVFRNLPAQKINEALLQGHPRIEIPAAVFQMGCVQKWRAQAKSEDPALLFIEGKDLMGRKQEASSMTSTMIMAARAAFR
jgi:hypothetical protein